MHVTFPSAPWQLEGVLHLESGSPRAAVVCHPHPLYGGNMNNPVVRAVEDGLQRAGYSTLRFNFRGTGESTGSYAGGAGELDDLRAAVEYLSSRSGAVAVTAAGYSFGAMVVLQGVSRLAAIERVIAVAPPLSFFTVCDTALGPLPKLFVAGDRDPYCPAAELTSQLAGVADPKRSLIIADADHFLFGHEPAIRAAVAEFCE